MFGKTRCYCTLSWGEVVRSNVASTKFGGVKCFDLSEQQYFWDTASQSTKRQGMLELLGGNDPPCYPWLRDTLCKFRWL